MPGETTMHQKDNRGRSSHIIIFLKLSCQNVSMLWYKYVCISSAKSKYYSPFTFPVTALSMCIIALFISSPPLRERNAAGDYIKALLHSLRGTEVAESV